MYVREIWEMERKIIGGVRARVFYIEDESVER